jgi:hypothetical protein
MKIFAPKQSKYFVPTESIGGNDAAKFVRKCYRRDIKYVAWDSRIGLTPNNSYYRKWGIDRIAMLSHPRSTGPYEFITQLKHSDRRYINVFRLHKPPPDQTQDPPQAQSGSGREG